MHIKTTSRNFSPEEVKQLERKANSRCFGIVMTALIVFSFLFYRGCIYGNVKMNHYLPLCQEVYTMLNHPELDNYQITKKGVFFYDQEGNLIDSPLYQNPKMPAFVRDVEWKWQKDEGIAFSFKSGWVNNIFTGYNYFLFSEKSISELEALHPGRPFYITELMPNVYECTLGFD